MRSELKSQEKNVVTITVTVDKADFAEQLKKTYRDVAKKISIPGFRKGKAPRNIIEMRVGKPALMAEALEEMIPSILQEVVTEYDLAPIAEPQLDIETLKENEDVVFTLVYEVEPEVTLPDLSEITAELPVFDVTDAMVDEAVDNMKKRFATLAPVSRACTRGDTVRAAYTLSVKDDDGTVIVSHDPQIETFELSSMSLRPEIVEALTGAEAGQKREAVMPIAPDYKDKTVAGKKAYYEFDVIEVQEPVMPEMNEDFFKKVAPNAEIHSEEELRAHVRATLDERLKADARTAAENDALNKITEATVVDLPESMVKRQKDHLRQRFEENVKQRTKMTVEEYYKANGRDIAELEENLERDARRDVLGYLVVDACGKQFGVSLEKEDLDAEIAKMAESYQISADSIKDMLKKHPEDFQSMISSARYRKTVNMIMEKVKITEVAKPVDAGEGAAQE
ncbi:MAG: trigger factor [Pyramidobacter sp.]|nr:trigger factor [Pyramidobacter sp.]